MLGAALVMLAAVALVGSGCKKANAGQGSKGPAPITVSLRAPTSRPVQRWVGAVGNLYGNEEATISAKVAGRVMEIYCDVGDRIPAGGKLAQIEKTDYDLALKQKDLAMRTSLSKLGLRELPPANFDIAKVPTVERTRLQLVNAEDRFKRAKSLWEAKPPLINEQDFQDMKTAWEVARSNYDVELLAAQSLLVDVHAKQADLEVANLRLTDTTALAPVPPPSTQPAAQPAAASYAVSAKLVSFGEYVKEGMPLFRLIDDDTIKLRASLPERYLSQVEEGQRVRVNVEAWPEDFYGTVKRINPQVDLANRTFQIEVLVANPLVNNPRDAKLPKIRKLKSGFFAKSQVLVREDPAVQFVPLEALVSFAGNNTIFTVKDGKAVAHTVKLGDRWERPSAADAKRTEQWVEVTEGLEGGDRVVVSGASKLANDTPVLEKTSEELAGGAATRPATNPQY